MIWYSKYLILDGLYPHIGLYIGLLADGNIHNIKLIQKKKKNISYNGHPVKARLTFCGVYFGYSSDIKGNLPYNLLHLIVTI